MTVGPLAQQSPGRSGVESLYGVIAAALKAGSDVPKRSVVATQQFSRSTIR
jgi:hypothetical protein